MTSKEVWVEVVDPPVPQVQQLMTYSFLDFAGNSVVPIAAVHAGAVGAVIAPSVVPSPACRPQFVCINHVVCPQISVPAPVDVFAVAAGHVAIAPGPVAARGTFVHGPHLVSVALPVPVVIAVVTLPFLAHVLTGHRVTLPDGVKRRHTALHHHFGLPHDAPHE
jgi:hypothetical protein